MCLRMTMGMKNIHISLYRIFLNVRLWFAISLGRRMSRAAREVQEPALDDVELRSEPEENRAPRKFCDGGGV